MQSGVYTITNSVTGKLYVGSSVNLSRRKNQHFSDLRHGKHPSQKLQRSFDKHGGAAFLFRPLLFCSPQNLFLFEQRALDVFDSHRQGYNVLPLAGTSRGYSTRKGYHLSEAHKRKIGEANRGRKFSAETRQRFAEIGRSRKGAKRSEAAKANMRGSGSGLPKGFKHSAETVEKIRAASLAQWARRRAVRSEK